MSAVAVGPTPLTESDEEYLEEQARAIAGADDPDEVRASRQQIMRGAQACRARGDLSGLELFIRQARLLQARLRELGP